MDPLTRERGAHAHAGPSTSPTRARAATESWLRLPLLLLLTVLPLALLGCGYEDDLDADAYDEAMTFDEGAATCGLSYGRLFIPGEGTVGKVRLWVADYQLQARLQVDAPWRIDRADAEITAQWPGALSSEVLQARASCDEVGHTCALTVALNAAQAACFSDLQVNLRARISTMTAGTPPWKAEAIAVMSGKQLETAVEPGVSYGQCCAYEGGSCTHQVSYWRTRNRFASVPALQFPWPVDEETQLCGFDWLQLLQRPPRGDAWHVLAQQWIAAHLNLAAGVEAPFALRRALDDRLVGICHDLPILRSAMLTAAEHLQAFNEGELGPGACKAGNMLVARPVLPEFPAHPEPLQLPPSMFKDL